MQRARLVLTLLTLVVTRLPGVADAFPIPRQPLQTLVTNSDLIIVANVVAVAETGSDNVWESAAATLKVSQTLMGDEADNVTVRYAAAMMCPAPASFEIGETVLAFLAKTDGGYASVGLSYGVKHLDDAERNTYIAQIRDLLAIRQETDGKKRHTLLIEWLVTCAEHSATRSDALYELELDATDRLQTDDELVSNPCYCCNLTQVQQARLFTLQEKLVDTSQANAASLIPILAAASDHPTLVRIAKKYLNLYATLENDKDPQNQEPQNDDATPLGPISFDDDNPFGTTSHDDYWEKYDAEERTLLKAFIAEYEQRNN